MFTHTSSNKETKKKKRKTGKHFLSLLVFRTDESGFPSGKDGGGGLKMKNRSSGESYPKAVPRAVSRGRRSVSTEITDRICMSVDKEGVGRGRGRVKVDQEGC